MPFSNARFRIAQQSHGTAGRSGWRVIINGFLMPQVFTTKAAAKRYVEAVRTGQTFPEGYLPREPIDPSD